MEPPPGVTLAAATQRNSPHTGKTPPESQTLLLEVPVPHGPQEMSRGRTPIPTERFLETVPTERDDIQGERASGVNTR